MHTSVFMAATATAAQEKNNGFTRVNTEARCGSLKTDHYLVRKETATAAMWRVARKPSTLKGTQGHMLYVSDCHL